MAAGNNIPVGGTCFLSFIDMDKQHAGEIARGLHEKGFKLVATRGTQQVIEKAGIECEVVLKISEGRPNIEDMMKNGNVAMAINTSDNKTAKKDAVVIRQIVLSMNIPYFTTLSAARATIDALSHMNTDNWTAPKALQDFLAD
jgi:carbamoyl-phosphate synthase large subunit